MKFFIDSGNLREIESLVPLGIIDGVTTNPSLMAKEGGDPRAIIKQICQLVQGPVSAEVVATDAPGMIAEGRELAAIDEHVVVKVPFTREGVKATKALAEEGHRVNVTLIFSATQALFAAKVGAAYVSPFVGRLDDIASDGMGLIRQIVEIFDHYDFPHRDPGRQRAPPDAHRRGGAHGRGRLHVPGRRHRSRASSIRSPTSASRSS